MRRLGDLISNLLISNLPQAGINQVVHPLQLSQKGWPFLA
jgi:hypothetical protein